MSGGLFGEFMGIGNVGHDISYAGGSWEHRKSLSHGLEAEGIGERSPLFASNAMTASASRFPSTVSLRNGGLLGFPLLHFRLRRLGIA